MAAAVLTGEISLTHRARSGRTRRPPQSRDTGHVIGTCIVRVESQAGDHLLISLTTAIGRRAHDPGSRTSQRFSSIDDAVAAVDSFLRGLGARHDDGGASTEDPPRSVFTGAITATRALPERVAGFAGHHRSVACRLRGRATATDLPARIGDPGSPARRSPGRTGAAGFLEEGFGTRLRRGTGAPST